MANIKKLLSLILSIAICIALFAGAVYAETSDVDIDEMAAALNRLNILQGNNGDYLLYDNLQRSQAVAFIIRMLGKEDYVKEHAEELRSTTYPDVSEDSWYAPYVGYSTKNNIVGGYLDGTFLPSEYTTEKAFLKMALCALDYEYGVDFNWSNVYQKAYEVGIVTDLSYSGRTDDDTDYLRSQAIEVLYRTLNTYKKGTQTKMILALVEEGAFTSEEVAASDILSDDIITKIESVTAISINMVDVVFNENINDVKVEDISIYAESDEDMKLTVQSVDFSENSIQIITSAQTSSEAYIIDFESVEDAEGNISGRLSATFEGYVSAEVKSDFFKISKVEQSSGNIIHVYFTHPVNVNSESAIYYELLRNGAVFLSGSAQNMTVKRMQSVDNAVSIFLSNSDFEVGDVYTLQVSGKLTSVYGVRLGDGKGDSYDFVVSQTEPEQLKISSIQAWTSDSVKIQFNHEIDPVWAGKKLNYTVIDPNSDEIDVTNAVVSTSGKYSGREVMLSLKGTLLKGEDYNLRIEYIPDIYKQSTIENMTVKFSGTYPANKKLALADVKSEYNNCVLLTFNKALDPDDATDISNYAFKGVSDTSYSAKPVKAYYSEKGGKYTVKLYLPSDKKLTRMKRYTVYAYNLMDSLGNAGTGTLQDNFTGGDEATKQWIDDTVTISKDAVKVSFITEIAFDPTNLNASNYRLEYEENGGIYSIAPIGVTYVDVNTLVLRFDELDADITYRLLFDSITDYSGEYTVKGNEVTKPVEVRWGK